MFKDLFILFVFLLHCSTTHALSEAEIHSLINQEKISSQDKQIESANFLAARAIIVDKSNDPILYNLEKNIQRKAVMKIVMRLSDVEIIEKCEGIFWDVLDGWHCKYIEFALENAFIAKNTYFRPEDSITKAEAMKLVLKASNIEKIQNSNSWQTDYMETALHHNLISEVSYDFNSYATRAWIFELAAASIRKSESIDNKAQ